jgi:hypothetical protein
MDPQTLQYWGSALNTGGQMFGAFSTLLYGMQAKRADDFAASQARVNAGQAQAASQRQAYEVNKQTQLAESRALAVAAASGGGASDPTVVSIIAGLHAEGAYQRSIALYGGDEQARALNAKADALEYEGDSAQWNSILSGGGQLAKATASGFSSQAQGESLLRRFGGDGPRTG